MGACNFVYDDKSNKKIFLSGLQSYQIIDANTSGTSAIARAGLGALVLGPIGLAAGLSAKKKYTVMLFFEDSQKTVTMSNWYFKEFLNYVAENNISSR